MKYDVYIFIIFPQIFQKSNFIVRFIVVCNAGYFKTGSSCELCTGNKMKSTPGDATDCDAETPCDGVTEVPDAYQTNCGL